MAKPELSWDDDLLDRKNSARFLTKLLMHQYENYFSAENSGALCFAVDADWGAGKSFFMDRWSNDLAAEDHPTIHFDAWANDLSDDPLVGFLARLQTELLPWVKDRPVADSVKSTVNRKFHEIVRRGGKALAPMAATAAAGIAKKFVGVGIDELRGVWYETQTDEGEPNQSEHQNPAIAPQAVDAFLRSAMQAHTDRQAAIANFQSNISELVEYLVNETRARAPLVVFIDELDRCRPDYAIRLLEGMKHLFNCKGVCFAVSTNLRQLSSSVRAVYGQEFDAYLYLKKFFSFEFILPEPDHLNFARSLMSGSAIERFIKDNPQRSESCLPVSMHVGDEIEIVARAFAFVARGLQLDLRSQRQVFMQAESALAGYSETAAIPFLYLFYLSGVRHAGTARYDAIVATPHCGLHKSESLFQDSTLSFRFRGPHYQMQEATTSVSAVISFIHGLTFQSARDAVRSLDPDGHDSYPTNLIKSFLNHTMTIEGHEKLGIALIPSLVRLSGYARNSAPA